ncbi:MAG: hypothetical protein Q9175_003644 [Cornicularia normoerica]
MPEANNIDLERCVTPSIQQGTACPPSLSSKAGRHCAIAVQHLDGRAVLINATIKEDDGDLVLSSARKQVSRALTRSWHQKVVGKLLMGLVVGTARVKQIVRLLSSRSHFFSKVTYCGPRPCSPGHQRPPILPSRVYLQDFTPDSLLTEALHTPHLLFRSATYPLNVDILALSHQSAQFSNDVDGESTSTCTEHDDQEVIVVRRVIDRAKVAWLLILLLFFSPLLGIGVGIYFHNADVGIAVSAGENGMVEQRRMT